MDVRQNIDIFMERRTANERYASFDYCFNYFQSFHREGKIDKLALPDNIEKSCLHLGFYLASWGMYRGSTLVLERSVKHYERLIKDVIVNEDNEPCWKIDVDKYDKENIERLVKLKEDIVDAISKDEHNKPIFKKNGKEQKEWGTLATKIMLGIFGNTPAFDTYFKAGMKKIRLPVGKFNSRSLKNISEFYNRHENSFSRKIYTNQIY
jgi:hypothetical protein